MQLHDGRNIVEGMIEVKFPKAEVGRVREERVEK